MWSQGILTCPETGGKYQYYVKHYKKASEFGIDGGRISKLTIRKVGETKDLYNYDRGLDVDRADDEVRTVYGIVLEKYN
ncbi:MAG: hypothetical protein LBN00_06545 [Oscillospiraceae bacterium]|jgi:hypothetical protein|nr:hypothetical protein [Oscillospiraceae bacterium]